ncbi:MAG: hypothetical protein ACUVV3_10810 [Dehalococcoidia bacterium]
MTLSLSSTAAQQPPGPPATFVGTVKVDGHSVPDGTPVLALIDGKVCGEGEREPGHKGTWTATEAKPEYGIQKGDSLYVVEVVSATQRPGCGIDGATVTFLVGGSPAHEVGHWKAGQNLLNLTAASPPATAEPATTPAGEPAASSDDSFNWWFVFAGGAGLVALAIAAVLWQALRATKRKQP